MTNKKYSHISTSALAKQLEVPVKQVFDLLVEKSWIERAGDNWRLTGKGEFEGGEYLQSSYGEYIGWPESVLEHKVFATLFNRPLPPEALAGELQLSPHRFNAILGEIGWQRKHHRGWQLSESGIRAGGDQAEYDESGVPFTRWRRTILENAELQEVLSLIFSGRKATGRGPSTLSTPTEMQQGQQSLNFDGVSQDEPMLTISGYLATSAEDFVVDNWFYLMGVNRAYQRSVGVAELGKCDFYLPDAHLHVEIWHSNEKEQKLSQKLARIEWYQADNRPFIEIQSDEVKQLDSILPKRLLKHGITVY